MIFFWKWPESDTQIVISLIKTSETPNIEWNSFEKLFLVWPPCNVTYVCNNNNKQKQLKVQKSSTHSFVVQYSISV